DNIFQGTIISHDHDALSTSIQWHDKVLSAGYAPDFNIDEEIDWVIPPYKILANAESEITSPQKNQMTGTIIDLIQLGEGTIVTIDFDGLDDCLQMNYSTHHIHEQNLNPGNSITVSLIPDGIHIMGYS
ncbi:MAG: TOBE domain-containing protein, partial [Gammaproteobacteria bacterium]|nr:TOBE domain-containing protein [Gammaproteobacteria bacterium]